MNSFKTIDRNISCFHSTIHTVFDGVNAEGEEYEESEDLFGGPRAPLHQQRHVKDRVEDNEEGVPEAHTREHIIEADTQVVSDVEHDFGVETERGCGRDDHQRLTTQKGEHETTDCLTDKCAPRVDQAVSVLMV